jgi:hypothetical protein
MSLFLGNLFCQGNDFVNQFLSIFSINENIGECLYGMGTP